MKCMKLYDCPSTTVLDARATFRNEYILRRIAFNSNYILWHLQGKHAFTIGEHSYRNCGNEWRTFEFNIKLQPPNTPSPMISTPYQICALCSRLCNYRMPLDRFRVARKGSQSLSMPDNRECADTYFAYTIHRSSISVNSKHPEECSRTNFTYIV
jgi:hypothetical protein